MDKTETKSSPLAQFEDLMSKYITKESLEAGVYFTPDPTDVIISTGMKTGTTWTQQICHGLRSGGDMSFDEIDLVVPTLEISHDYGIDINASQHHTPRMFKSHLWYHACPKGAGKYITVVRYPKTVSDIYSNVWYRRPTDSALSMFNFFNDWLFVDGELSVDAFVEYWYKQDAPTNHLERCTSLYHIMSWYPHRLDKNVLWLHYEDLQENLRGCVRMIADFLDIGKGDDELQELVTKQAGLEFMQANKHKFNDHQIKLARNEVMGLPRDAGLISSAAKVHIGQPGRGKILLSTDAIALIDEQWKKVVTHETGHADYDSFRRAINAELGRSFLKT